MREQIINFETAIVAKEKGLPQIHGLKVYSERLEHTLDCGRGGEVFFENLPPRLLDIKPKEEEFEKIHCVAPTQSELQRWLREVHEIYVIPPVDIETKKYSWELYNFSTNESKTSGWSEFETYEEALELGLIEGLKLIKNG